MQNPNQNLEQNLLDPNAPLLGNEAGQDFPAKEQDLGFNRVWSLLVVALAPFSDGVVLAGMIAYASKNFFDIAQKKEYADNKSLAQDYADENDITGRDKTAYVDNATYDKYEYARITEFLPDVQQMTFFILMFAMTASFLKLSLLLLERFYGDNNLEPLSDEIIAEQMGEDNQGEDNQQKLVLSGIYVALKDYANLSWPTKVDAWLEGYVRREDANGRWKLEQDGGVAMFKKAAGFVYSLFTLAALGFYTQSIQSRDHGVTVYRDGYNAEDAVLYDFEESGYYCSPNPAIEPNTTAAFKEANCRELAYQAGIDKTVTDLMTKMLGDDSQMMYWLIMGGLLMLIPSTPIIMNRFRQDANKIDTVGFAGSVTKNLSFFLVLGIAVQLYYLSGYTLNGREEDYKNTQAKYTAFGEAPYPFGFGYDNVTQGPEYGATSAYAIETGQEINLIRQSWEIVLLSSIAGIMFLDLLWRYASQTLMHLGEGLHHGYHAKVQQHRHQPTVYDNVALLPAQRQNYEEVAADGEGDEQNLVNMRMRHFDTFLQTDEEGKVANNACFNLGYQLSVCYHDLIEGHIKLTMCGQQYTLPSLADCYNPVFLFIIAAFLVMAYTASNNTAAIVDAVTSAYDDKFAAQTAANLTAAAEFNEEVNAAQVSLAAGKEELLKLMDEDGTKTVYAFGATAVLAPIGFYVAYKSVKTLANYFFAPAQNAQDNPVARNVAGFNV